MANIIESVKTWIEEIENDQYLNMSKVEISYITYATCRYIWYNEKTNMSEFFGEEYKNLNLAMSNIYSQVDKIKNYRKDDVENNIKYDSEKIKELRLKGYTAKEICVELGYPESKSKSLTSNKGWKEANIELKQKSQTENTDSVQKIQNDTEKTEQKLQTENTENIQKSTDSVQMGQNVTDLSQMNTDSGGFDF